MAEAQPVPSAHPSEAQDQARTGGAQRGLFKSIWLSKTKGKGSSRQTKLCPLQARQALVWDGGIKVPVLTRHSSVAFLPCQPLSSVLSPFASQPPQRTVDCFHPPAAPAKGTQTPRVSACLDSEPGGERRGQSRGMLHAPGAFIFNELQARENCSLQGGRLKLS